MIRYLVGSFILCLLLFQVISAQADTSQTTSPALEQLHDNYVYLKHSVFSMENPGHLISSKTIINRIDSEEYNNIFLSKIIKDNSDKEPETAQNLECKPNEKCQWLIHIEFNNKHIQTQSFGDRLKSINPNILFINYIPQNTYHVYCTEQDLNSLYSTNNNLNDDLTDLNIISTTLFRPEYKISNEVYSFSAREHEKYGVKIPLRIMILPQKCLYDVDELIKRYSLELTNLKLNYNMIRGSTSLILLYIDENSRNSALNYLSKQSEILWIEGKIEDKLLNSDAVSLIQSGFGSNTANMDTRPIHSRGITGENQIIAVGDDILDINSCFFVDKQAVNICSDCSLSDDHCDFNNNVCTSSGDNSNQRKIAGYWRRTSAVVGDRNHASHVCGSVAGRANSAQIITDNVDKYNGVAPSARLVFTQLGVGNNPSRLALIPPDDLNLYYFPWSYHQGARIMSNSWGGTRQAWNEPEYMGDSAEIDEFAHNHQDFLILFAAGNNGIHAERPQLSSEATTKNSLVVGASQTTNNHFVSEVSSIQAAESSAVIAHYICDTKLGANLYGIELEKGNPSKGIPGKTWFQLINQNLNKTDKFNNEGDMFNYYCGQYEMNKAKQQHYECTALTGNQRDMIGMQFWLKVIGAQTYAGTLSACESDIKATYLRADHTLNYNEFAVAEFSSVGPTQDKRIKPDILAPGNTILSARSHFDPDSTCSVNTAVTAMDGTSMATPIAAGASGLVRQYYMERFHEPGCENGCKDKPPFIPPAALIKATLINSGMSQRSISTFFPSLLGEAVDFRGLTEYEVYSFQGFGRINLSNSLMFTTTKTSKPTVKLFAYHVCTESSQAITTGAVHTYNFHVTDASRPFKATLVWSDPPGSYASSQVLVNDLDLTLNTTNIFRYGNPDVNFKMRDFRNNVEQIELPNINVNQMITIKVHGYNVPKGPQSYALVVTLGDGLSDKDVVTESCVYNAPVLNVPYDVPYDYQKTILIIFGVFALVAILGYIGWYYYKRYKAQRGIQQQQPSRNVFSGQGYRLGSAGPSTNPANNNNDNSGLRAQLLSNDNLHDNDAIALQPLHPPVVPIAASQNNRPPTSAARLAAVQAAVARTEASKQSLLRGDEVSDQV